MLVESKESVCEYWSLRPPYTEREREAGQASKISWDMCIPCMYDLAAYQLRLRIRKRNKKLADKDRLSLFYLLLFRRKFTTPTFPFFLIFYSRRPGSDGLYSRSHWTLGRTETAAVQMWIIWKGGQKKTKSCLLATAIWSTKIIQLCTGLCYINNHRHGGAHIPLLVAMTLFFFSSFL
jgi:hypothetical protein